MRRIYYGLGAIAVAALLLIRCWHNHDATGTRSPRTETSTTPTVALAVAAADSSAVQKSSPLAQNSATSAYEDSLIHQLHKLEGTNPDLAISLALEDRQRNPKGPDAEERDMVLVAAYYNDRDLPSAKREAWYYFVHYPNGRFTEYLSKLTGLEPPKSPPPE